MRAFLCAAVLSLCALVGGTSLADAQYVSNYTHHRCPVRYKRVRVPYYKFVAVTDCYGEVTYVRKLCYRYKYVRIRSYSY